MTPRQGCAFIGNFASIHIFVLKKYNLVRRAFNLNINVLIAIEIHVFLSFHRPKVVLSTFFEKSLHALIAVVKLPAVFSSIEIFDKEVCQALDSPQLN